MRRKLVRRIVAAVTVALAAALLAAAGLAAGAFAGFDRRASDSLYPSAQRDKRVVVVGIDAKSLREIGLLPWDRSIHAEIGERLREAGADVVAWDVIFAGDREGDAELAAAIDGLPNVVLAESIRARPSTNDPSLLEVTSAQLPASALLESGAAAVGQAQVLPDPTDGVVRTLPLVVEQGGTIVPAFSLAAFQAMVGASGPPTIRPDGVQVGGRFIPTEGRHLLRLNFAEGLDDPAESPAVVSAVDVLRGRVDPERLRGKTVLIGATEPTLGDNQLVPFDKSGGLPGVMIHANALDTLLTASYLEPVSDTQTVLWVALFALLVALAVLMLPVWLSVVASAVLAVVYVLIGFLRFDDGTVMNLVYPLLGIAFAFVTALGVRYITETRQRRRVSSLFAQYVPEEVARQLEESGSLDIHLDGERLDVSLFFCDLRGFTTLSSTLEPAQVRGMLNLFYELVTDAILRNGGTVLKFVGDEVFAVFGAPLPVDDHPQRSLDCAMEIQHSVPALAEQLAELGIPPVMFGIGMNSGDVVAAHVGGGRRRQYDVVGDTVNLASRLCGQAGKGEIVLTDAMRELLTDPPKTESMGAVALKGLDAPVPLCKVAIGESESRLPAPAAG